MKNNPKVFISYAHKNQAYEDKVLKCWNWQIDYVQKELMR